MRFVANYNNFLKKLSLLTRSTKKSKPAFAKNGFKRQENFLSVDIDLILTNLRRNSIISLQHHTRCKLKWKLSPLFIIQSKRCNTYKIPYLFTTYNGFKKGKWNRNIKKCAKVAQAGTKTISLFLPRLT